jgi:hypothetical protein
MHAYIHTHINAYIYAAKSEFKHRARDLQEELRRSRDVGAWVPQSGRISGKTHWLNVDSGEVCMYVCACGYMYVCI